MDPAALAARNRKVARNREARLRRELGPEAYHELKAKLGRAGYKSAVARGRLRRAHQGALEWRRAHPSEPMRAVMAVLDARGVGYGIEHVLSEDPWLTVDVLLADGRAIEANGRQHYEAGAFGEDDPDRPRREAERIAAKRGYVADLLVLDMRSGDWRAALEAWLWTFNRLPHRDGTCGLKR